MSIPTRPAAYWHPDVSLSEVYSLRGDYTWHYNITGREIPESEVPDDLVLLGEYKQPYTDPTPYVFVSDQVFGIPRSAVDRGFHGVSGTYWAFSPRPGYSQNKEDYA